MNLHSTKSNMILSWTISLGIVALICIIGTPCNAGWSLSSSSGPAYYHSATEGNLFTTSDVTYKTGTLAAGDTSLDLELDDMSAESTAEMGCVEGLSVANVSTNAWLQAAAAGSWSWPGGGAPTTTTVSNYFHIIGGVHVYLQAQPSLGSTATGQSWIETGTNGLPPNGYSRALAWGWVTNNSPSGVASLSPAGTATWATGYPTDVGNTGVGFGPCNGVQESCNSDEVTGNFVLESYRTTYTLMPGATYIAFTISATMKNTASVGGTGGSAYAETDGYISNGSRVLAYIQN